MTGQATTQMTDRDRIEHAMRSTNMAVSDLQVDATHTLFEQLIRERTASLITALQEFDESDDYHRNQPTRPGYYGALSRVEALLRGDITCWTDAPPTTTTGS